MVYISTERENSREAGRIASISIDRSTGWGRCFNASCNATVLISEFNPELSERLLQRYKPLPVESNEPGELEEEFEPKPTRTSSVARPAIRWQQDECAALLRQNDLLCQALFDYHLADCWQAQAYLEARSIPLEIADQERVAYFPANCFTRSKFIISSWRLMAIQQELRRCGDWWM